MHINKQKTTEIIELISIPLVLMAVYLSMLIIWGLFNLPRGESIIPSIQNYFSQYGLWIVLISALIEGFFIVGQYFPGGTIIFLGVISANGDILRAIEVVIVVSIAFFISYTLNFLLGKYGWYKLLLKFGLKQPLENAKVKLTNQGLNAIIFSYWEPNLASITATASGILQFKLGKFLFFSGIGIIMWNVFWGTFVFILGNAALKLIGFKYVLIIFLIWIGVIIIKNIFFAKINNPNKIQTP